MNYIELDSKELQEVWEQLTRAVIALESSTNLTPFEQEERSKLVRRLNRRYEVLSNRAQYNRILKLKMTQQKQLPKFLKGLAIGIVLGLFWYGIFLVVTK